MNLVRTWVELHVFVQFADIVSTFASKDLEKHTAGTVVLALR